MAENEFEQFLSDSFREGVYYRELRLSEKELTQLKAHYPKATVKRTSEVNDAFSKAWYEVNLLPIERKAESVETIRLENLRLKKELETLRKINE